MKSNILTSNKYVALGIDYIHDKYITQTNNKEIKFIDATANSVIIRDNLYLKNLSSTPPGGQSYALPASGTTLFPLVWFKTTDSRGHTLNISKGTID